jgi:TRAP-type uncharacterized transport system fused permease subunit
MLALAVAVLHHAARLPDLTPDDPSAPVLRIPETFPTFRTGMHFLLPVVTLIWCLMVEGLSAGLSAFWACAAMIFIVLTQKPLLAFFRGGAPAQMRRMFLEGARDLYEGMATGARNMIAVGVATAAAGIIVGTISQTGLGQMMTEIVEALSGGSLFIMLLLTALISLVLGMGIPTTATYIVVSGIMAGVVTELGRQQGLVVPPIAVHLFVFYFGILADITPPVGLAAFAVAAIAGGDPFRTGWQAFLYSTRTLILPFFFIYNTKLLLIGVDHPLEALANLSLAVAAVILFSSGLQGYFRTRSRWYESAVLLVLSTLLLVPTQWLDLLYPRYSELPAAQLEGVFAEAEPGSGVRLYVAGENKFGEPKHYYVHLTVPDVASAKERLAALGLTLTMRRGRVIVDDLDFSGTAMQAGLDFGNRIEKIFTPAPRPSREWAYGVVFVLAGLIFLVQHLRAHRARITHASRRHHV